MASSTFLALMDQVALEPGLTGVNVEERLIIKLTGCVVAATSTTCANPFILSRLGTAYNLNLLQGWHIHFVTNNQDRTVTTISVASTGTITINHIGGDATVVASNETIYLSRLPWPELMAIGNDVLEYIKVPGVIPLGHGPDDYDLQDSDTVDNSWTESNATDTVQTTAAEVAELGGARSLVVTDSGSGGGYTQSTTLRMGHSQSGTAYAIAKADTGTSALRIVDQDGNTVETVSFTQEDWLFIKKRFTLGSTDEGAALRLLESTASASGDWQSAWIVKDNTSIYKLPSYVDERFKLNAVKWVEFRQAGDEADTWLANSARSHLLTADQYRATFRQADANSGILELFEDFPHPLFMELDMPYSAPYGVSSIFTLDTSTTNCPAHLFTANFKERVGGVLGGMFPEAERRGSREFRERSMAREQDPVPVEGWYGPIGGRRL